ncbi:HlyD family efflux transporter periplasmic adaptor subunit, partial [Candidatus Microgenomates bacterium]|nr:HlyD family efflux transporter periplasmic adaptor subunit [Candidatus Microgenomates bacterium]
MTKFLQHKKAIIFVAVAVLVIFLIYKNNFTKNKNLETSTKVSRKTLTEILSFSGKIDAQENVNLRFQTSGYLNWVGVKKGDHVNKFQVIASLDQRGVQKNLQKDLNDYMTNRWSFDQQKDNYKNQIISPAIQRLIDESQFSLNNVVLDVELQNLAKEYSNLWTPIEGIVVDIDSPNAGVNITPTQATFNVVNPDSIYFSATADQSDVIRLQTKMPGKVSLDSFPDQKIDSEIKDISFVPKTGETGTVYEVKMALPVDNSSYKYRIGMTGDASFVVNEVKNALSLPTKYVKTS